MTTEPARPPGSAAGGDMRTHYGVLGVDRSADARAIKQAYFRLVRQFPPETEPDAFRQLREAYEALSDPDRRRAYDAATRAYADPTGGRLTEAQHALDLEDWPRAIALLEPLVAERPDLHAALDLLGQALLLKGDTLAALDRFHRLIQLRPDVAAYQHHLGLAMQAAGALFEAIPVCQRALELDPQQPGPYRTLIELARATGDRALALQTLDAALPRFGTQLVDRFNMTLQRLRIEGGGLGPRDLVEQLRALVASVPADTDEETRKYLVGRLSSIVAWMFSVHETEKAQQILLLCKALRPGLQLDAAFPVRIDLRLDELPDEKRAQLLAAAGRSLLPRRVEVDWTATFVKILALGFITTAIAIFPSRSVIWAGLCLADAGAVAFVAAEARRLWLRERRTQRFLHGPYFMALRGNRVRAWALFRLARLSIVIRNARTRHPTVAVRVRFPDEEHVFRFRDREIGEGQARDIDRRRVQAMELLAAGLLEEDPEARFFPSALLVRSSRAG